MHLQQQQQQLRGLPMEWAGSRAVQVRCQAGIGRRCSSAGPPLLALVHVVASTGLPNLLIVLRMLMAAAFYFLLLLHTLHHHALILPCFPNRRFIHASDTERSSILKMIPHIEVGSWVVKQAVGSTPFIVGRKLATTYHLTKRCCDLRLACCGPCCLCVCFVPVPVVHECGSARHTAGQAASWI